MQPKLIILNGPCGIGKTTLAKRYISEHDLCLNLDIDSVTDLIGTWRKYLDETHTMRISHALLLAKNHLLYGHDVIIPNILKSTELDRFADIAQKAGARPIELVLLTSEEDAIARFIARGKSQGFADGFRPGGTIDTQGRERKLQQMHADLLQTIAERPQTIIIESVEGKIDDTYAQLLAATK